MQRVGTPSPMLVKRQLYLFNTKLCDVKDWMEGKLIGVWLSQGLAVTIALLKDW